MNAAIRSHLLKLVFKEDATYLELLTIALAFSVLWFVAFKLFAMVVRPWAMKSPALRRAQERDYDKMDEGAKDFIGVADLSKEEAINKMLYLWPTWQALFIQHVVGGSLCIPSLFGSGDSSVASSLAVCGILSEVGWEIEDFIVNFPLPMFMVFHHSLASVMGLPMVKNYRTSRTLHWLCFDLQIIGLVQPLLTYTSLLDVTKRSDLFQMKFINIIYLIFIGWTRGIHWCICVAKMCMTWYHDEVWVFFAIGTPVLVVFSLLNFMFVTQAWKRCTKFLNASAEVESLPADAPETKRRQSLFRLQEAVDEIAHTEFDIAAMIEELFETRDVKKRHTIAGGRANRRSTLRRQMMGAARFHSAPDINLKND